MISFSLSFEFGQIDFFQLEEELIFIIAYQYYDFENLIISIRDPYLHQRALESIFIFNSELFKLLAIVCLSRQELY